MKLVSRDEFRNRVLARAGGSCCVPTCTERAVDAHHILNRNLFLDENEFGGYFLENGAQLCSDHHYEAECTRLSVEDIRAWCSIKEAAIPSILHFELSYDCWGNEILPDGRRTPGPLYDDSGFQKLLSKANLRWLFY
jgi:hypothetical protein